MRTLGTTQFLLFTGSLLLLCVVTAARRSFSRGPAGAASRSVYIFPALVFGLSLYLLFNNFFQTIFGSGVLMYQDWKRVLFGLLLIACCFYAVNLSRRRSKAAVRRNEFANRLSYGLYLLAAICTASSAAARVQIPLNTQREASSGQAQPDIYIVSVDALDAAHLSLYGYERKNAPFLEQFAKEAYLFENAFSNANNTLGSLTSVLTGRLPSQTRVLNNPENIRSEEAFLHLPYLLRQHGYSAVQMSVRDYADAADTNLREAFQFANGRTVFDPPLPQLRPFWASLDFQLASRIARRIQEMVLHPFYIQTVVPQYDQVTRNIDVARYDRMRVATALQFVESNSGPVFVHLHLLSTHGPRYPNAPAQFAAGKPQSEDRDLDYYDDTVLLINSMLSDFFEKLRKLGRYENALIFLHSDHSRFFSIGDRIPLLIKLPAQKIGQRIASNAQLLDIAPTVLARLGLQKPNWMSGADLFDEASSSGALTLRPIVAFANRYPSEVFFSARPPLYNFFLAEVISCDSRTRFALPEKKLIQLRVEGHTSTCGVTPEIAQAIDFLKNASTAVDFDAANFQQKESQSKQ
jgi:hypothetical protein